MSEGRKKPGVAFWATVVLVAVLIGYPLSLGPWIAFYCATHRHQNKIDVPAAAYRPVESAAFNSSAAVKNAYTRYVFWWGDLGFFLGSGSWPTH